MQYFDFEDFPRWLKGLIRGIGYFILVLFGIAIAIKTVAKLLLELQ